MDVFILLLQLDSQFQYLVHQKLHALPANNTMDIYDRVNHKNLPLTLSKNLSCILFFLEIIDHSKTNIFEIFTRHNISIKILNNANQKASLAFTITLLTIGNSSHATLKQVFVMTFQYNFNLRVNNPK